MVIHTIHSHLKIMHEGIQNNLHYKTSPFSKDKKKCVTKGITGRRVFKKKSE